MTKSIALDTNTYAAFLKADSRVVEHIKSADEIIIPFVVIGELYYGFYRGTKAADNISILDKFLKSPRVMIVHTNDAISLTFGEIATELANVGKPMQQNDIWIAAVCKQNNCSLLSYDQGFKNIIGLKLLPL